MTIKIHGLHLSPFYQTVANICKEVGVSYEFIAVPYGDAFTKSEDYLTNIHPFGKVPVLFDGDFRVYESRAIARYLVRKYGADTGLLPAHSDIEREALFEQAASIEQFDWQPYVYVVLFEVLYKRFMDAKPDEARLAEFLGKLKKSLEGYERILSKQKYLAGDVVTLADLFHLSHGTLLVRGGINVLSSDEFPNVARWWKDISNRPAWLETQGEWEKHQNAAKVL